MECKTYRERDALLKKLGFSSYADYRACEKWQEIRSRVFAEYGRTCVLCPKPATAVHHVRYTRDNLCGESINGLYPICWDCHQQVEMANDRKRSLREAQGVFAKRLKKLAGKTATPNSPCTPKARQLKRERNSKRRGKKKGKHAKKEKKVRKVRPPRAPRVTDAQVKQPPPPAIIRSPLPLVSRIPPSSSHAVRLSGHAHKPLVLPPRQHGECRR